MPASFLLATENPSLLSAWSAQVPAGRPVLGLSEPLLGQRLPPGLPVVIVLDAVCADKIPTSLEQCPLLLVGEPHSRPFEELRQSGRAQRRFSYEESLTELRDLLPLVEELAERNAAVDLLMERLRRSDPPRQAPSASSSSSRNSPWGDTLEIWDFLEAAVENLSSRERILSEFRRAARYLLRASHTVFLLREEGGFRADRGSSFFPAEDPGARYLALHPLILDGVDWPGPPDPVAELSLRNRMALWGARLLVPLHDHGQLLGLIACGVRDDGQPFDEADKSRAVFVGRLLRQFLRSGAEMERLASVEQRSQVVAQHQPPSLVLSPGEEPARTVPVAVRALIGRVRQSRDTARLSASADQPLRASAGFVAENGLTWASWEDASEEVFERERQARVDRLDMLRELALTLNHEIGNSLVSLAALRHAEEHLPAPIREAVRIDVTRLETLNRELTYLAALSEPQIELVDLRELLQEVGSRCSVRIEIAPQPVPLAIARRLVDFALDSVIRAVTTNRGERGTKDLSVQLRSAGSGDALTALVSIKGGALELEGILPARTADSVPNQGNMGVFIAKEVIRLHGGSIHAGPGMEGTEILISLRKW
jgi:hypothetical protein